MTLHWAGKHCATNNYIRKRASDMTGALRCRIQNGNLTMRNSGSLTPRTPGPVLPLHPTIWKPVRSYSGGWRWGWGCVLLVKACLLPASSLFSLLGHDQNESIKTMWLQSRAPLPAFLHQWFQEKHGGPCQVSPHHRLSAHKQTCVVLPWSIWLKIQYHLQQKYIQCLAWWRVRSTIVL